MYWDARSAKRQNIYISSLQYTDVNVVVIYGFYFLFAVHKPQWDVICKQTKCITNSMDHSPSSEASRLSESQESPPHFMEPQD